MMTGRLEPKLRTESEDGGVIWTNPSGLQTFPSIDAHIEALMLAEALREEDYIRRHAPIFFDQGYRLEELQLHRSRKGVLYPERDLLCLMPRYHVAPAILAARVRWRRWFPYKVPTKGNA
jgi:hypothetical protein